MPFSVVQNTTFGRWLRLSRARRRKSILLITGMFHEQNDVGTDAMHA